MRWTEFESKHLDALLLLKNLTLPVETNQRGGGGTGALYIFVVVIFLMNRFLMYFITVSMYNRWGGWALTVVRDTLP